MRAMSYDVVTFGEAMIRLSPPGFRRLEQTHNLEVFIGGAELNVAVGVSRLGRRSAYVTRLTNNPLGRMIANRARELNVSTDGIVWTDEDRVGVYFLEFGASPRASSVLYDRRDSAIAKIQPGMVDWNGLFAGYRALHTSGITPALSSSATETTVEAMKAAREAGALVSVDLNYRAKLWNQQQARRVMTDLMQYTNVLITTEEDTDRVFGIREDSFEAVAEKLTKEFPLDVVAITLRENPSVWHNQWTAIACKQGKVYRTRQYEVEVVDRLGAGDSFSAGFLHGLLDDDVQKGVDYGVALSALKHSLPGDLNWSTLAEVEALIEGGGLRISR
jgi:2-dehydro-3-deoxygluconokinase